MTRIPSAGYGAIAVLALLLAYDPTQSTGTGTHQGGGAETKTTDQPPVDSRSGKNEDSGSAVGAERPPAHSGAEAGKSHGSLRSGSKGGRSLEESGAGTTSGAAKPRK